jgi:hypothetical protein
MNQLHSTPTHYFCKILFNMNLPFSLGLPDGLIPSGFSSEIPHGFHISPLHATCPIHLIICYVINLMECHFLGTKPFSMEVSPVTTLCITYKYVDKNTGHSANLHCALYLVSWTYRDRGNICSNGFL